LKEYPISNLYDENSSANVGIVLSLEDKDKTNLQDIQNLKIKGSQGNMIQ
jgi:multidrug efflux pump subunit AcrB